MKIGDTVKLYIRGNREKGTIVGINKELYIIKLYDNSRVIRDKKTIDDLNK